MHESGINHLSIHAHSPCYNPRTPTYLAPSSCDRNRPPRSQVVCKLLPLAPHCFLVFSPPKSQPFLGFPRPNVHLIKTRLNPLPRIPNSYSPGTVGMAVLKSMMSRTTQLAGNSMMESYDGLEDAQIMKRDEDELRRFIPGTISCAADLLALFCQFLINKP
jgi:hypothetical protein